MCARPEMLVSPSSCMPTMPTWLRSQKASVTKTGMRRKVKKKKM